VTQTSLHQWFYLYTVIKMKKEYNIKDQVWIAMGERRLVEGRVVEIIDLAHLNEGHDPNRELYIVEVKTGIDDIYEVRTWEQMSSTASGPLNMFKHIREEMQRNNRYLKKIGIPVPLVERDPLEEIIKEMGEPTDEEIHEAIEKSQLATQHQPLNLKTEKPKRRQFRKKKQ
jgi:hypothetical protein